jgi:two-component system, LuxR family, sensor kinase FixL
MINRPQTGALSQQEASDFAAERRFRVIVEAAPNAMVMSNAAGEIVMVNAQAERVFGYPRDELIGNPIEMLVPERFRPGHPSMCAGFHADPRPRPMGAGRDLYGLRKNGSEFPVEIGLNPIETDDGVMVLAAIVDITERKAAVLALRQSQTRLQVLHTELLHVSRLSAMGEMAAAVAHELNQPLTAIGNYMETATVLLDRGGELPAARLRGIIERAGEQAVRAGQIIHRLRSFISRGDSEKRIEAVTPLVKEAAELALVGTRQRGINIKVEADLPDATIMADRIQIQQVLLNLLRNAVEAVADRDDAEIALIAERRDAAVQISVVDNGPGLPDEVRTRLFQPFVSTKKTGMGVGLSICHTIATAHDGRLWAEPNPGGGTIFRLSLPLGPGAGPRDG